MTPSTDLVVTGTPALLDLESFARACGLHPELVRRLVALGLLEPRPGPAGALRFIATDVAVVARLQRLRTGFALNWAAVGLVCDLLDRIDALEAALRWSPSPGGRPWT